MSALYGAVPVVEVYNVPVLVPHDLHLNVPVVVDKPAAQKHQFTTTSWFVRIKNKYHFKT